MSVEQLIIEAHREARSSLDLSGLGLTSLPPEITRLREIRELFLHDNQLRYLPPEVGRLDHLESLTLHGNQLQRLPPEIRWWTELRRLTLHDNRLTTLPPEFGQLQRLRYLALHRNLLESLPREFCDLIDLRDLYLADNALTRLPEEIGDLERLRTLDLSRNRLERLPPEFGFLPESIFLKLEGNPLVPPLPELFARSTSELLTYIRSQAEGLPQYEARVLLVGDGNAGKTSLLAALKGEPFVLGRSSTHGLNVATLAVSHSTAGDGNQADCQMRLNVWDFAGQEIYRTTHQLFFSSRSLYLLVYNARESQQARNLRNWLRQIRSRIKSDVRILLVATHCEEQPPDCEYAELKREFGEILVGHFEVDNRTGLGLDELKKAVADQAFQLPEMGEVWNPTWLAARDDLLTIHEPQISYDGYLAICAKHGLSEREADTLIGLLHDLGHLIHYDEPLLCEHVILNPEWLANAMSNVLLDEPTRRAGGVLEHARLPHIWSRGPQVYPRELYPFFLRLMEAFDLSYRMDGGRRSLVAPLVPAERPELPWQAETPPRTLPNGETESVRAMVCRIGEQGPTGLLSALMVRFHRISTGIHWRQGVLFEHEGHQALVDRNADGSVLRITVRGVWPDHLLGRLRDGLDHLLTQRWPGVKAQMLMSALPMCRSDQEHCQGLFATAFLAEMRSRGVPQVMCQGCYEQFPVASLQPGFAATSPSLAVTAAELEARLTDEPRRPVVVQMVNDYLRLFLRATSREVRDVPSLFELSALPKDGDQWTCRFTLFDQHHGGERPYPAATFSLELASDMVTQIAPYAELVHRALRLVALRDNRPFPGQFNEALLSSTDERVETNGDGLLTRAQREGLHRFRALLLDLDTEHDFGGLLPITTASGDRLWVSPEHHIHYDHGNPMLDDLE